MKASNDHNDTDRVVETVLKAKKLKRNTLNIAYRKNS